MWYRRVREMADTRSTCFAPVRFNSKLLTWSRSELAYCYKTPLTSIPLAHIELKKFVVIKIKTLLRPVPRIFIFLFIFIQR